MVDVLSPLWARKAVSFFAICTLGVLFAAVAAPAQEQTLFDAEEIYSGGFGGPQVMWTTFNGEHGLLVGGQGAWVINKTFYLGGGGFGLTTRHEGPRDERYEQTPRLRLGYGGFIAGIIIRNDDLVHNTVELMIGGGAISNTVELNSEDPGSDSHGDEWKSLNTEGFWHVQPMAHVELNVTTWMRVAVSGGYRLVRDFGSFGMTESDASGPVAGLTIRFGQW